MKEKLKRLPVWLYVVAGLVLAALIWFAVFHFSMSEEEKAYNTALRYVGAMLDEKMATKPQKEEKTTAPIQQLAKKKEADKAKPYFEKYEEQYVTAGENSVYQVEIEVKEMIESTGVVTKKYTYDVTVEKKGGEYEVTDWERRQDEEE